MNKTKDQFRIKNRDTGKYLQNGTGKYHWSSLENAISAARRKARNTSYYSPGKDFDMDLMKMLVIERYELVLQESIDPVPIIEKQLVIENKQRTFHSTKNKKIRDVESSIEKVFNIPGVGHVDIRNMYDNESLNDDMMNDLAPLFEELEKARSLTVETI